MSLTRRVYGGKKSRNSKKGRGHCRIGGKKTLKKGGKRVLSLGGKSPKNRKKSKRRSKGGGGDREGRRRLLAAGKGFMVSELSGPTVWAASNIVQPYSALLEAGKRSWEPAMTIGYNSPAADE